MEKKKKKHKERKQKYKRHTRKDDFKIKQEVRVTMGNDHDKNFTHTYTVIFSIARYKMLNSATVS